MATMKNFEVRPISDNFKVAAEIMHSNISPNVTTNNL
jgi:hypothetical protein